jgi:predicted RNase H-like HicB family nuclease
MQKINIEMTIKLPVKFIKRKGWYVAKCTALDVVSQGETLSKAKKNLIEALSLFLVTCLDHGTLSDVLKECGFAPAQHPAKRPASFSRSEYVDIPIHLLAHHSGTARCRA